MDQKELQDWSRHFDVLLWGMVAFAAAGIGAFWIYSSQNPLHDYWGIHGCKFQRLRRKIHEKMDTETIEAMRPLKLKQWPVLLIAVAVLTAGWIRLLIQVRPTLSVVWVILGVIAIGLDIFRVVWGGKATNRSNA